MNFDFWYPSKILNRIYILRRKCNKYQVWCLESVRVEGFSTFSFCWKELRGFSSHIFPPFFQFSLPALSKSSNAAESPSKPSFTSYGGREITKTGVSIQPKGFYRLDSKKSIGSFNPSSQSDDNSMTQTSSYSFSSSSSSRSTFRY